MPVFFTIACGAILFKCTIRKTENFSLKRYSEKFHDLRLKSPVNLSKLVSSWTLCTLR
jgi:hypothetical protein